MTEKTLAQGLDSPWGVSVMESVRRRCEDLQVMESITGGEGGEAAGAVDETDDILEQLVPT